jgi:hypothetical protein
MMLDRRSMIAGRGDIASPDYVLRLSLTYGARIYVFVVA